MDPLLVLLLGWHYLVLITMLTDRVDVPICTFSQGWTRINSPEGSKALSMTSTPDEARTLFVGTSVGLFRSDDCMTTSTKLPVTSDLHGGQGERRAVETVAAGRHGVVYVGGHLEGPSLSHDGGATWTRMNASSTKSIVASQDEAGRAYGSFYPQYLQGMRGLYRSDDAGRSWTLVWGGLIGTLVGAEFDINDTVYIKGDRSLNRIDRKAEPFGERPVVAAFPGQVTAGSVRQGGRLIWASVKSDGLYWSTDFGSRWEIASLPPVNADIVQLSPYVHDERVIFAVTAEGDLWVFTRT